ncbi:MAG: hypothetical protein P4L99_25600 [Chthoniobacter sp.]|nr:hypothetical protein [Chthoniobacter sp.]
MSGKSARFTRVEIVRVLGIGQGRGFAIENLSPAVNIIHGPNGSGKSTLSRVMQKLLWPAAREVEPDLAGGTASGNIEVADPGGTRPWRVDLEAGTFTSTVQGTAELPPAGSPDLHARYRMPITELLVDNNAGFAREILRQVAGGFDLDVVARDAGFGEAPTNPRALQKARRDAAAAVQKAQERQGELERDRSELGDMQLNRQELEKQLAGMRDLEHAKDHLTALADFRDREEICGSFDTKIKTLTGTENAELEGLEKERRDTAKALETHDNDRSTLAEKLKKVGATEAGLQADYPALEAAVEALETAEETAGEDDRRLIRSGGALEQAKADLFKHPQAQDATVIDHSTLDAADELFTKALSLRVRKKEHETEARRLQSLPAPDNTLPDASILQRGIATLANWLHAPALAGTAVLPLARLGGICALLAIASLAAAVLVHWGFAAGAVCALAVFAAVLWLSPRVPSGLSDPAAVHRQTFEALSLAGPAAWEVTAVTAALSQLVQQLERRTAQEVAQQARNAHQQHEAQIEASETQLANDCAHFENRIGIRLGEADQTWIRLIVQKIQAWQQAAGHHRADQAAAQASADALSNARQRCFDLLQAAGVNLTDQPELTHALASRYVKSLEDKRSQWENLNDQLDALKRRTEALTNAHDVAMDRLTAFWQRMELPQDDVIGLAQRLRSFEDYNKSIKALEVTQLSLARTQGRLGAAEPFLARGLAAIEVELEQEPRLLKESETLQGKIAGIEAELKQAMAGHDVSKSLEALAEANTQLLRQEERNADLAAANALVGWLRDQARAALAPRVLTRARDLVTQFTQGRLTFDVQGSAGDPRFVAANAQESWRPVTKLSSGERVQLLMAVRLAFLEENEERALPLLLDEILASSDDERTGHIIRTVVEIARTGRQVFYFTAQAGEVAKWISALADAGIDSRVIDLRTVRGMADRAARPFPPAPPQLRPVPEPASLSHREYGELLQAPGIDPWDATQDQLHVWHVIEDTRILHRVLESGVERLGPLERLVGISGFDRLGESRDAVLAVGIAFRAACLAWRVGRGRPVGREELLKADGVSANFLDRLVALASEVEGDARQFMACLEAGQVKGWREKASVELRNHLTREGYLAEAEPLRPDEIREAVLAERSKQQVTALVKTSTLDRILATLPK